jgi:hypothetical protein
LRAYFRYVQITYRKTETIFTNGELGQNISFRVCIQKSRERGAGETFHGGGPPCFTSGL